MKLKELKRLRALIKSVIANSGEETVERDQLLKADRVFEKVEHSGKLDRYALFHAVRIASEAMIEISSRQQSVRQE